MKTINAPLFCLTSDVDWASDYAIRDLMSLVSKYHIKPTFFATHKSAALDEYQAAGAADVGIHPNFLPGSTHGNDQFAVIEHMLQLFPNAKTFRAHCFMDSSLIALEMYKRGLRYDSNLCLFMQPNLAPLRHSVGLVRYPVFWEDDAHWINTQDDWNPEQYLSAFLTPGLKIVNVHPFFIAANVPNHAYYQEIKPYIGTLSAENIEKVRYKGPGARTFFCRLLEMLAARHERFYTLDELYRMFPAKEFFETPKDETAGRVNRIAEQDYQKYWQMSDHDKQEFVKQSFEQRNPTDLYATSRDYNVRELEIHALKKCFGEKGSILDLGCGNGYTLIALAEELQGWSMLGIDFSENLIKGAHEILEQRKGRLHSAPEFLCADAIAHLKNCRSGSVSYVVSERFLQNMPSVEVQKDLLREIYRVLAPGGRLLMCEGSEDGFENLNEIRYTLGLSRIPTTGSENVSAIRFWDKELETYAQQKVGFKLHEKFGFSLYFLVARVLHPLLVAPQNPRFDAKINDLAMQLQQHVPNQPGYGSNTLWVFEK